MNVSLHTICVMGSLTVMICNLKGVMRLTVQRFVMKQMVSICLLSFVSSSVPKEPASVAHCIISVAMVAVSLSQNFVIATSTVMINLMKLLAKMATTKVLKQQKLR